MSEWSADPLEVSAGPYRTEVWPASEEFVKPAFCRGTVMEVAGIEA